MCTRYILIFLLLYFYLDRIQIHHDTIHEGLWICIFKSTTQILLSGSFFPITCDSQKSLALSNTTIQHQQ